ncbi:MAG: hypothetical protein L6Q92_12975 [Phycisphaerae bacterium]|nr:hypothetical protein [Phycisphaerae bacterium]
MRNLTRTLLARPRWLPVAMVFAGLSCIPDGAIREVAAENIVRTITLYTSSFISLMFLNFFPF